MHPAHIVLATGTLGAPHIPDVADRDMFQGAALHASEYNGGDIYSGKRAVVVGAGNTSADICQDLVSRGAQSVTMVQRSSTCVVTAKSVGERMGRVWPEGVPTEICDIKFSAMPVALMRKMGIANEDKEWAMEAEMYDGLRKAGLKLNMGTDGAGQYILVFERFGGKYCFDVH